MVSELRVEEPDGTFAHVLILVLMEHGLGVVSLKTKKIMQKVLILVLMEHGLGATNQIYILENQLVLILVLMEHGLGEASAVCFVP